MTAMRLSSDSSKTAGQVRPVTHRSPSGGESMRRTMRRWQEDSMVDVLVYDGGQERYPLLFGVE